MTTNFEKYLAGEPVNETNAALKRGELREIGDPLSLHGELPTGEPIRGPLADPERPLKPDEQAALREMRQGPGWPVLQRLLERSTISTTNAAILLSQDDPAAKKEEIAQAWLTVKTWKQLVTAVNYLVMQELAVQQKNAEAQRETESAEQGA